MNYLVPEQMIALQRQQLESLHAMAMVSLEGLERLAQLNMQATKASLKEGVDQTVSLLESRDVKSLQDTIGEGAQPAADKFQAYAKHVYEITQDTSSQISRIVEQQWSEGNRQLYAAIDSMAKNAPAGSEGMVSLLKSAVTAANTAWDEVNKAGRKVAEISERNAEEMTNAANNVAKEAAASTRRATKAAQ